VRMRGLAMERSNEHEAIVNVTRITVRPVKRERGCLNYRFYEESEDKNTFVLIGEWASPKDWNNHLYSDNLAVLLGSISLLCDISYLDFKLLSHITSGEAMSRARMGCYT
jgi:quinol monooxygenase YgiN